MKFSIIIPVYNVVAELPRTIDSLRSQIYRDFEIVLIDDGSTDGSSELVDSYANIATVIHQTNMGVVAARQNGFEASKGEWILFVDGDDELMPEALAQVSNAIDEFSPDVVQFGFDLVRDDVVEVRLPLMSGFFLRDQLLAQMKKTPLEFLGMCIWNKCYRREIVKRAFDDVGDVRISHSEDGLFAFATFFHVQKFYFIRKSFYKYILRSTSALHRVNTAIVDEKESYIARLEQLMKVSHLFSDERIGRCLDFHCYEAACYVFLMLRRNHAARTDCSSVLRALNKSQFFRRPNREWHSLKRRIMRWLLKHPYFYCIGVNH